MFCPNCNVLTTDTHCPLCGSRNMRMPEPGDFCFLTEQERIWADMLSDVLSQNGISFVTRNVLGAGITAKIGPMMERIRFYAAYADFDSAADLTDQLFPSKNKT